MTGRAEYTQNLWICNCIISSVCIALAGIMPQVSFAQVLPDAVEGASIKNSSTMMAARNAFDEQEYVDAVRLLELELARAPSMPPNRAAMREAFAMLGQSYYHLDQADRAQALLEKALALSVGHNGSRQASCRLNS